MARFSWNVSSGGRSHTSCWRLPSTRAMRRLKAGPPPQGAKPATATRPALPHEHLERRGLSGAVRAQERDDLPRLDCKRHVAHGVDVAVAGLEERLERALEPWVPHFDLEGLAEPIGRDGGRHSSRM